MLLGVLGLVTVASPRRVSAQINRAFTQRFPTTNTTGYIVFIGNTLSTCDAAVANCVNARAGVGTAANLNNDAYTSVDVDVDGDGTTFNSSSATLTLASGDSVMFAGLYWGAYSANAARNTVLFRTPAAGYTTITATQLDQDATTTQNYQGFRDVTALVRAGGSGNYFVANVQRELAAARYAGWALVVVLYNQSSLPRSLVVFDGYARVFTGVPVSIAVSGLNTPPAGSVNTQLGVVAYEGDLGIVGDVLQLNSTTLSDAQNPANNPFNSSLSILGTRFTAKNPDYVNQLAFDADIFDASNILPNGATTATINLSSTGDQYYPGVVAFANQLYSPNLSGPGSLEKTAVDVNGGSILAGDTLEYTINMTNTGLDTAVSVVLIDTIPANASYAAGSLTFVSSVAGGPPTGSKTDAAGDDAANFDAGGNRVLFRIGAGATAAAGGKLGPTQSSVVRFRVVISGAATAGTVISNQARVSYVGQSLGNSLSGVSDDPGTPGQQPTQVTVTAPDLSMAKSHTGNFTAGVAASYTLTISNGGTAATFATITAIDSVPAGLTPTGASGSGWSCGIAGQIVTCTNPGPLATSATSTITVNVNVLASAVPSVTNIARVTTSGDGNAANNRATDATTVGAGADLSITKTDGVTSVNPGASLTYTIVAGNAGPSAVTAAPVTDTFDPSVFNVAGIGWTCAASAGSSCTASGSGNINTTVNLLSGGSATFTVTAPVLVGASGTITNTATIAVPAGVTELAPANNSGTDNNTVITTAADLGITKTDAPDPVTAGSTITYTLTATNNGPAAAQTLSIQDNTPTNTTFLSATPSAGGSCTTPAVGGTGLIDCSWAGATATGAPSARSVTIVVTVGSGTANGTVISNTGTASSATFDPVAGNNSATATTTIAVSADVAITQSGPASVVPGTNLVYTVTVTNTGPSDAAAVSVANVTPAGLTFVSNAGACTTAYPCGLGTVAAGATRVITTTFSVPSGYAGANPIVNAVTVSTTTSDPVGANNTATTSTPVAAGSADVSLTKTGPASVTPGQTVAFTVTVTNLGPSDAAGVSVADPTPAGLSFLSNVGACVSAYPCALGTVPAGASRTITTTYQVPSGYAGANPIVNTATASTTTSDPVAGNNAQSANVTVNAASADLAITKVGPASVVPGTSVVYSITVTNNGPSDAAAVSVADPTPAGLTFSSNSGACSSAFPCALGVVAAGATRTITTTYLVPPGYAGASPIVNSATVSSPTSDPVAGNNSASASTTVSPASADLGITKTGPASVVPGTNVVYTITVTNAGPSNAAAVSVADVTPAGLTFVSNAGACTSAFPCALGTVTAGASQVITTTFAVPPAYAGANPILNTASVSSPTSDPVAANNSATASTPVAAGSADLVLTKTGPATVTPGQTVAFAITITNSGPSDAAAVSVADPTPAGLTFLSNTGNCVTAFPCALGTVPSGATRTITATYSVPSGYSGASPIANTATVTSSTSDPAGGNNAQTANVTVNPPAADVAVTKTGPASATPGQTIVYTVTITNNGPSDAAAVSVTDATPAGLTFISNSGACGAAYPCALGAMTAGSTRTITTTYQVPSSYTGANPILNTASASSPTADPVAGNGSATASTTVNPASADLAITKLGPASVVPGTDLVYTITLTNNGPSDATGVSVADVTPSGTSFVSNSGDCATAFPCNLGTVPAGASRVITATFAVPSGYAGANPIVNATTASAATGDPVPGNNTGTVSTPVSGGSADLHVTHSGPASVTPGQTVAFTITLTNNGPSDAANVNVADATPAGLTFLSTAGNCVTAFPCALGTVPAGATRTIIATYQVPSGYAGANPILNTASATSATSDPNPGDEAQTVSVAVNAPAADLHLTLMGPANTVPGTSVVYTITVTNNGPSDAASVSVADPTPAGLAFVSTSGACTGAFPCALGPLVAGAIRTITATYQLPSGYSGPSPIVNTATASSPTADPVSGNESASVSTTVDPASADLAITKTGPANVVPGTDLIYTITVTNSGPSDASGVSVADATPAGVTFVSTAGACSTAFPCNLGTVAAGASLTITATYNVASGYAGPNPIVNAATVSATTADPVAANNSANTSTPVNSGQADLTLTLSGPAAVTPGQTLAFTITVTNNGPSDASGVSVADATPAGLSFVSTSGACSTSFPCALGTVPMGQTRTITVTYQVPPSYAGPNPIVNSASVTSATPDPTPGDEGQTVPVTVNPASADLSLSATGPASVTPGQLVVYSVSITNNGPSDAASVTVTDPTPAGLAFVSNSGACSGAFPCALGTVSAGATLTITATFRVPSGYSGPDPILNTATVSSPTGDPVAGNESATVSTTVNPASADLAITKTGPASVVPGTDLVYTITLTNNGPSDAASVSVADITPSGLTFVSTSGDCVSAFPCSLGTVVAGASRVITATFAVPSGYAGANPIVNATTASAATGDPVPGNNTGTVSTPVSGGSADLHVTHTGPASVTPGQTVAFTITLTNNGPSDAANVNVADATPPGLTFLSTAGNCVTTFPCALGTVPAGATRTIIATYQVPSGYAGANPILNTASATSATSDPNPGDEGQTASVAVNAAAADLHLTLTGPASATPGQLVAYTITVTNNGPSDAASVSVADPTPAGLAFVSTSGACTGAFPCALGPLVAGATRTITATYQLPSGYSGPSPIVNTATASSPTGDPITGNESANVSTTVNPASADLAITMTGPASVVPGTDLVYTITVTNGGPSDANGVSVADATPAGVTFVSTAGACATAFPCGLGVITAGTTVTITATYHVASGYAGANPIVNAATVSATTADPVAANNSANTSTPVNSGQADLTLTLSGPAAVTPGQTLAYTITVTNNGPSDAAGVSVADATPAGLSFVSTSGACGTPLPCALGTVPSGQTRTLTVTYRVPSGYAGANPIINTASVTSVTSDPAPGDESQSLPVGVNPAAADLSLTATGPVSITPGQLAVYTITVTNNGPSDAASVAVTDPTPTGLGFVSTTGDCTTAFPCALGSVSAGATRTITATFLVPSGYSGPDPILDAAAVSSPTGDPVAGNESATVSTTVNPASADLAITKTGPASVVPGTDLVYTITLTNNGPSDAASVSVADITPSGLSFVSTSGDCVSAFPCSLGTVVAGASRVITATFAVPSGYAGANPIVNTASVSASTGDPVAANNAASSSTPVTAGTADLSLTASAPASVVPGTTLAYTITVTNAGPSDAAGVSVADATPAGVTFVSNAGACTTSFPCNLGTVPAGQSRVITATYLVPSGYAGANPILNTASVTSVTNDPNTGNEAHTVSVAVNPASADLSIAKLGPASVTPGQNATYMVTITNNGPSDAASVAVADPIPGGLSFVSNSGDCTSAYPCALGTVASGTTRTITTIYHVPSGYAGPSPIVNTASVSSPTSDPVTGNESATTSTPVNPPAADLQITKTGPASVIPGSPLVYTITVTNNGPSDATGVSVADLTPSGLTFTSNAGACVTAFPCSLGPMPAGSSQVITASFDVPSGYAGANPIVNTASVSAGTGDPLGGNNSSTTSTPVAAGNANLTLTNSGPASVTPGQNVTFTITVTNTGPSDAAGVSVADATPTGLVFVSTSGDCTTTFPCNLGTVPAGQTRTITATFLVPSSYSGPNPILTTASVTAATNDPSPGDEAQTIGVVVNAASADLVLTKSGPATVIAGQDVAYTVTVTNNGPSDAASVSVADATPIGLAFVSTVGACTSAFPCALGTVPAGASRSITATYHVPSSYAAPSPIANTATVSSPTGDPVTGNESETVSTTLAPASADVTITVTGPAVVTPGANVAYTLTVTNGGPSDAQGVTIDDPTPSGLVFVSATGPCASGFPCAVGTLAAGASLSLTVTFQVPSGYAGPNPITNAVSATSTTADPAGGNNATSASTTVASGTADLAVTMSGPASAPPGTNLVLTISVTNNGPSDALAVSIANPTPAGLTFVSATGACAGTFPCAVGTILVGQTKTITATYLVPSGYSAPDPVLSTASASTATSDPIPGNDAATVSVPLGAASADLDVTITAPASVLAGQSLAYTITVTNAGPADASGVSLANPTPAGLTFVSNSGACTTAFPCALGNIPAGQARTVTATYLVPSGYNGANPIADVTSVSSPTADPAAGNNSAGASTSVSSAADLAISSIGPASVTPGRTLTLTLQITNTGPSDAAGVSVDNPTPAGLTFVSNTGACTTTFPCSLGVLTAGVTRTITATYQVPPGYAAPDPIVNSATVTTSTTDPVAGNNNASVSTSLAAASADLAVTKTGPASVLLGSDAVYTVTVTNSGPSDAAGVSIADPTPPGLTFVSATAPCAAGFPCALGTMAPGGSVTITVTYQAPLGYSGPDPVVNTATVSATTADPSSGNNSASASTAITQPSADLSVVKAGPASVVPGTSISYSLTVANAGPDTAHGVSLADPTPAGLTFLSASAPCAGGFPCALGTMAAGASAVVTVNYAVPPDYAGSSPLVNTATVSATTADPVATNNSGSASATVAPMADLGITKTDGLTSVTAGSSVTYTIVVTNAGPSAVRGAPVDDPIPAQLTGVTWTCVAGPGAACSSGSGVGSIAMTVDLGAGASATILVSGTVSQTSGVITNTATIAAPPGVVDPVAANNSATDVTTVNSVDVQVTKTHSGAFTMGGTGSYTITVTNLGTVATSGATTVIDSLPAGLAFGSASGAGWSCSAAGSVMSCTNPGPIAPNTASSVALTVTVAAGAAASVINVARVQTAGDVNPANDRAIDPTAIVAVDLALAKRHSGVFSVGQTGDYILAVTNRGTAATIGTVTVTDTLPQGLTFASATGTGWSCAAAGSVVTCTNAGPVVAGDSSLVTVTVNVGFAAVPQVTNGAVVTTPGDTSSADNAALDAPTVVLAVASLAVEKEASRTEVEIGDQLEYTIRVRNTGVSPAPDVTVDDRLPAGFSYVTGTARRDGIALADPTGGHGPQLVFTLDTLAPTSQTTLTYRVRVLPGAGTGDGINRALARSPLGPAQSNEAAVKVRLLGGVFTDEGLILGKVYAQGTGSGVPGVRIYLEDGTSTITDTEGKYSFYGITPRLHIVKLDATTLPAGAAPVLISNRQAGNAWSHFADVQRGELHRADFALGGTFDAAAPRSKPDSAVGAFGLRPAELPSVGAFAPGVAEYTRDSSGDVYGGVLPSRTLTNDNSNTPALPDADLVPTLAIGRRGVVTVQVPLGAIPADATTMVPVAIRLLDAQGAPLADRTVVTLEASAGRWQVEDDDPVSPGVQTTITGGSRNLTLIAAGQAGQAQLRVSANGLSGSATLAFVPARRPLLAAGVVEGRLDLRSWSLPPDRVRDRFEDELRALSLKNATDKIQAGTRAALFVKGTVGPEFVIDLRLDTERDPRARLFRDIRPEEFYPVYGDASVKEFDAQSTSRLYLRVEKARNYFLFGDYGTVPATEVRMLGAYTRSLNGALQHFESRRSQANLFASRGHESQIIDEFPGRGTSGPFVLSQKSGLTNSERVEIITRDRNQPAVILKSELLTRFADYTIEPFTGRLLLKAPVPSVDQNLNPVSIRVTYEVDQGGTPFWTFGADAQIRATDRLELGGSAVHDDNPLGARSLVSGNATIRLGARTYFVGEAAHADSAGAAAGGAFRFELRHFAERWEARAYGLDAAPEFTNPSSALGRGRREYGLRGSGILTRGMRVTAEALRSEDLITHARRIGVDVGVERELTDRLRAELGLRHAELNTDTSKTNSIHFRLTGQLNPRAAVFGEYEQSLSASDAHRALVGGDYRIAQRARLYARHELISSLTGPYDLNGSQHQNTTVIGLDADYLRNGSVFTEYRARDVLSGREAEAAIGLRNRWTLAPGLRLNTSFERVSPLAGAGGGEATALTGALDYSDSPVWRGSARLEYRTAPSGDNWLASLGYGRKLSSDWTALGRSVLSALPSDELHERTQIGIAFRQTLLNRWSLLARYEHKYDRDASPTGAGVRDAAHVFSSHVNFQPVPAWTFSGELALKLASEWAPGGVVHSHAELLDLRAVRDLDAHWDVGATTRALVSLSQGRSQYGVGLEVGRTLRTDLRVALGYNLFGFRDRDLTGENYTDQGVYVRFGLKFDEGLLGLLRPGHSPAP